MARDHEDQIRFIGVGGLDSMANLEAFVDEHELDHFRHAASEDGGLFVHFQLNFHPAWVVLDRDGEVVLRGARLPMDEVTATLEALAEQ